MHTVNKIENFCFYRTQEMGIFFNQSMFNVLLQPCWNCWGNLKSSSKWKWPVRIRYFVATSKFKVSSKFTISWQYNCSVPLTFRMKSTSDDDCGLSPFFCTDLVPLCMPSGYCSKDRHYYSSCCHCYFRAHCFCCC